MSPEAMRIHKPAWLSENGPRELELLFRAVVFRPRVPILVTDDEQRHSDVSMGACKLLGLPRRAIIGQKLEQLTDPGFQPQLSELWRTFLKAGEQQGTLRLTTADGVSREVEFSAKGNVLPVRHVLVLRDKTAHSVQTKSSTVVGSNEGIPAWVQDYALFLLDGSGCVASWYAGAARIYGYTANEATGRHVSFLYASGEGAGANDPKEELDRAAAEGHCGMECWHVRKDQSRFWANAVTLTLRDQRGELQGFARVVRDFSELHEAERKLSRTRGRLRPVPSERAIAGIASGEFDQVREANNAFLDLVGYTREDLRTGGIEWLDLTPSEHSPLDDLSHEECLCYGACTPYEKDLVKKDGTRVPVLITTAVLKLSPFRWITFVQDLTERDQFESDEGDDADKGIGFEEMVGSSASLRRIQRQVEVVAPTDANVLILGETGTGKELVARAVHRMSPRRNFPFVTLNCAAIPTGLLESELFGYERGAFTGALSQKIGRFEMANHGTLFLDEVGDIPLELQPKLLRALQEKAFERLGGTRTIPIDVRLLAATNRNLTEMMGDKLFRSDLYYRLRVFPIVTPPLRDHPDDIPALARHFADKYAGKMGRPSLKIPPDTMRALVNWHWPGNVRELENFIERSVILSSGATLRVPLGEIRKSGVGGSSIGTMEQVEREHILRALRESGGVVTAAAARLGLHRTTLNAMMRKIGISRKDI